MKLEEEIVVVILEKEEGDCGGVGGLHGGVGGGARPTKVVASMGD